MERKDTTLPVKKTTKSDQVKEFIKYVVNKYMNGAIGQDEEEMLKRLKEIVEED